MDQQPWYQKGLRFTCSACGNCCTGAPGFVWVNKQEIQAMAAALEIEDVADFERHFVRKIGIRKSLQELPTSFDCVLLDARTRACRVYAARPRQCRTWPFWDSNLRKPGDWEQTCQVCPGSGKGKLYQLAEIEQQRKVIQV